MSYTEAMLNLLAEEGGEQLQSLGTIKGVEAAMKFIMSGSVGDYLNYKKIELQNSSESDDEDSSYAEPGDNDERTYP